MTAVLNARDMKGILGVNVPFDDIAKAPMIATAMSYIGTRKARMQFSGDNTAVMAGVQDALVSGGYYDPNLWLQLLLNGYIANANTNTLSNQQSWILASLITKIGPNGTSILRAIEGPNEMNNPNVGQGSRGPNDLTDKTDASSFPNNSATANANLVDWAHQVSTFRSANSGLAGVELTSGTVVYFFAGAWNNTQLDVSSWVDYPTFHYYAGVTGTTGVPSYPPAASGNMTARYANAQAGLYPSRAMVMSEGGASTESGSGGYSQVGALRYHLLALCDAAALGARRSFVYNLVNNAVSTQSSTTSFNEDNFGLFWPDGTPKPGAIGLRNMQNLLSLGLSFADSRNFADVATIAPAWSSAGLSITGLTSAGTSGSSIVANKSDGSSLVILWNEPPIDTGGAATTPAGNTTSVDLGSVRTWRLYDPTGGGNVAMPTATATVAAVTTGTSQTVPVTLYGSPMVLEIVPPSSPASSFLRTGAGVGMRTGPGKILRG
jgi:hypothetical protein